MYSLLFPFRAFVWMHTLLIHYVCHGLLVVQGGYHGLLVVQGEYHGLLVVQEENHGKKYTCIR